ncbi:MAG: glycosyltransferase family 2 protein [Rugosibacter sp.]|nr:glycosyltransferase family 2 protein [Rugosibacter sp.]
MSKKNTPEVSVCICTYKRPALLLQLLESLAKQTFSIDRFEVIVVDNDKYASAKPTILQLSQRYPELLVQYEVEPKSGISYARNKTVALASGELLAFIDDDEWAVSNWLSDLVENMANQGADAVLGPVIPQFPEGTRPWAVNSRFFERPRFATGTSIGWKTCRTGNALVKAHWPKSRQSLPFGEHFALSGGEDSDFFKWLERQGGKLIWCDTAAVNEIVPLSRQTLRFILQRCLRTSTQYWRDEYKVHPKWWALKKAFFGLLGGTSLLLLGGLLLPLGLGQSVRTWSKGMKGFGRVAALANRVLNGYGTT